MRLSTALVVCVIAPLILVLALLGWIGLRALEQHAQQRKQDDIQLIARALRLPLSRSLERGRVDAVSEALHSAFAVGRVYGARIFDDSGALIAGTGVGTETISKSLLARVSGHGDRIGVFERVDGEELYSYYVPLIASGGESQGILEITRRGAEFEDELARIRLYGVGALAGIGTLVACVVLLGHRYAIGKPMGPLVYAMRRAEAGQRGHRTPVTGPSELRTLALGFNAMLAGIERSEQELAARREREQTLEEELRRSQKLAAIGVVVAGVAHQLGTPLSVIDGRAQRLLRRQGDVPGIAETVHAMRVEVERMEAIIRQLMDFARRNPIEKTSQSVARLVDLAVSAFNAVPDAAGVDVQVRCDDIDAKVTMDRDRLEQALVNLLVNAAQAAGPGGRVRICWRSNAARLDIRIDDDGPGVAPHVEAHLFEPFFTTKSAGAGTGLGLAVAYRAVEDHGGQITVERSPDLGGARFRITLPSSDGVSA